jgi:hypothetical protein
LHRTISAARRRSNGVPDESTDQHKLAGNRTVQVLIRLALGHSQTSLDLNISASIRLFARKIDFNYACRAPSCRRFFISAPTACPATENDHLSRLERRLLLLFAVPVHNHSNNHIHVSPFALPLFCGLQVKS